MADHASLVAAVRTAQNKRRKLVHPTYTSLDERSAAPLSPVAPCPQLPRNLTPAQRDKAARFGTSYEPHEESLRNDLALEYVNSGRRPQNFVQNSFLKSRFHENPRLAKLLQLHAEQVDAVSHNPIYIDTDLRSFDLASLAPIKFDTIVINPPLPGHSHQPWSWDDIANLPIPSITASRAFLWLWVGNNEGLEKGREILAKWGFRRCEDIVWLESNPSHTADNQHTTTAFRHSKQHCLMGIKGTVRRSFDGDFSHCNIDTDVIIWENPDPSNLRAKPPELQVLAENFCMGVRRLDLFGTPKSLKRGWLSIGQDLKDGPEEVDQWPVQPFDKSAFESWFAEYEQMYGNLVVPTTQEIDAIRPKTPTRGGPTNGGLGRGRGRYSPQPPTNFRFPAQSNQFMYQSPPQPTAMLQPFYPQFQPMPMSMDPYTMQQQMALMAQQQEQLMMQNAAAMGMMFGATGANFGQGGYGGNWQG